MLDVGLGMMPPLLPPPSEVMAVLSRPRFGSAEAAASNEVLHCLCEP